MTAAGVGVQVSGLSLTSLVAPLSDRRADVAAVPLGGPPRVPLDLGRTAEVLDWPDGTARTRALGDSVVPVAEVPGGLLVVIGGTPRRWGGSDLMTRSHAWSSLNSLWTASPWPTTGGGRRAAGGHRDHERVRRPRCLPRPR